MGVRRGRARQGSLAEVREGGPAACFASRATREGSDHEGECDQERKEDERGQFLPGGGDELGHGGGLGSEDEGGREVRHPAFRVPNRALIYGLGAGRTRPEPNERRTSRPDGSKGLQVEGLRRPDHFPLQPPAGVGAGRPCAPLPPGAPGERAGDPAGGGSMMAPLRARGPLPSSAAARHAFLAAERLPRSPPPPSAVPAARGPGLPLRSRRPRQWSRRERGGAGGCASRRVGGRPFQE